MPYIVQKSDFIGGFLDVLVSQEGAPAHQMYKDIEKRMGRGTARILQR